MTVQQQPLHPCWRCTHYRRIGTDNAMVERCASRDIRADMKDGPDNCPDYSREPGSDDRDLG